MQFLTAWLYSPDAMRFVHRAVKGNTRHETPALYCIRKHTEIRVRRNHPVFYAEERRNKKMFKNEKIEKRLTKSFILVSAITSAVALLAVISMIIVSNQYSHALIYFGFAEGDIGTAMTYFADTRSATRAAIGYDAPEAIEAVLEQHTTNKANFEKAFATVEETVISEDGRATYDAIAAELDAYWELDEQIVSLGSSDNQADKAKAQALAIESLGGAYSSIYTKLTSLLEVKVTEGDKLSKNLSNICFILAGVIVVIIIIALIVCTRMGKTISRAIARPLEKLGQRLKTFADGDLASPFPAIHSKDEVADIIKDASFMANKLNAIIHDLENLLSAMASGDYAVNSSMQDQYTGEFLKLLEAMDQMRVQMTKTLQSIGDASTQVSAGSGNLADASQNLAEGATEQAGAVEELQATIISITETIEKSAESAKESYLQAQKYADEADNSQAEMQAMVETMERINESSKKIENIISEIESIASQTNLLSLNASIEAARAGEAGRGFAVVAEQIRQLAEQSAKAVVDTRELIEGSLKEIVDGNRAAERASQSIGTVVEGIKQIALSSKEISSMAADQAVTMREAEQGVGQISEVVQNNSATAQESSATSQQLSAQAIALDELIGQFKLSNT